MHASTTLLLLVAAGAASAQTVGTEVGFGLRAFSTRSEDIQNWAVVNAHVGAGDNVLEVQRPTASEPDHAFFNGTSKQINNGKARLAFCMSIVPPCTGDLAEESRVDDFGFTLQCLRITSSPSKPTSRTKRRATSSGSRVIPVRAPTALT